MPIRDLVIFLGFGIIAPMILFHPYIGALLWVLFGLLNPHRLMYGPAYNFPFAMVVVILTFIGILLTRDHRKLKGGAPGIVLVVLTFWVTLTSLYPLTYDVAWPMWTRVVKIFAMTFVLMFLLHTRRQVELLLVTIVVSIGFYGVKGGVFTVVTGGNYIVYGPNDTLLEANNHLAVAIVMIIPLIAYYYERTSKRWLKMALLAAILCCAAAALGSYSRGAVLALGAMGLLLWLRSSRRFAVLVLAAATAIVLIPLMPDRWDARMHTIETYEAEGSAMSRIYAWRAAWNIATDRFLGGGFEYASPEVSAKYSPAPDQVVVAHSVYFQMLGEHGFVGLALFLIFWALVWRQSSSLRRQAKGVPELRWVYSLMSMVQASLVGYAVGGAFINIAFWDMPYYLFALITITGYVIKHADQPSHATNLGVAAGTVRELSMIERRAAGQIVRSSGTHRP